jgi:hypothetical protein
MAVLLTPACGSGNDGYVAIYDNEPEPAVSTVDIALGGTLESDPGQGAGLNVEASVGGVWRLSTTCDTTISGVGCTWDIVASVDPDAGRLDITDDSTLDSDDVTSRVDDAAVRAVLFTGEGEKSVTLTGPDGADLTVDAILDDLHGDSIVRGFVSWVSDGGAINNGAPSNPVVFHPVAPP